MDQQKSLLRKSSTFYTARRLGERRYELTKWVSSEAVPEVSYVLTGLTGRLGCNCPGSWKGRACKHLPIMTEFLSHSSEEWPCLVVSEDGILVEVRDIRV